MSYVLVTGGAGYIGSHTVVELFNNGYKVVIVDNLINSSYDAVARLQVLCKQKIPFFKIDINDVAALDKVFKQYQIDAVLHFAALKAVGESTKIPLEYYENNVGGAIALFKVMQQNNCKKIVFSSSATVYGDATRFPDMIPIPEHCPTGPTNPYGMTKITIENIMRDLFSSDKTWKSAILRYFNPIGAHTSGLIGEDPLGIPNNLLPFLAQVAIGRREKMFIFGNDYDSRDGTPIRDYIHVVDLAKGHIAALDYLNQSDEGLCREWNLGTGNGSTVFEVFNAFCKAVGRDLPFEITGRRDGDVLNLTADPRRANKELKWTATLSIDDACRDLWKWTTDNPMGFQIENYKWNHFKHDDDYEDRLHTLTSADGKFKFSVSNLGATIVDASLNGTKLCCGFETEQGYLRDDNPYFGATIGRIANRISGGKLTVNDTTYQLPVNEKGINTLHGGSSGFDRKIFLGPVVHKNAQTGLTQMEFLLIDKDGENHFPGELEVKVTYTLQDTPQGGAIEVEYEATLSNPTDNVNQTAVSLTNHTYWNIGNGPTIEGTEIALVTNKHLEVDSSLLPTGEITTHAEMATLSSGQTTTLGATTPAFDHCFTVSTPPEFQIDTRSRPLQVVARAYHPDTKIGFTTATTEPSVQLYTGDYVDVGDGLFGSRAGFCLETARYIDAGNNENWRASVVLNRGEVYGARTQYGFSQE